MEEMEENEMTTEQLAAFMEMIAKLVEKTAKTPAEAAQIIRDAIPKEEV